MTLISDVTELLPALPIATLMIAWATYRLNQVTARRARLLSAWDNFTRSVHYAAIELLIRADASSLLADREASRLTVATLQALETIVRQTGAVRQDWKMVLLPEDHRRIFTLITRYTSLIGIRAQKNAYSGESDSVFGGVEEFAVLRKSFCGRHLFIGSFF